MLCPSPVPYHGRSAPCGRCVECRQSRRRVTVTRLLAEGFAHDRVSMLTLTYRPSALPRDGSLVPLHLVGFFKRLRINYVRQVARDPHSQRFPSLRFFAVGEYGGRFGRPHFHVICFGADRSTVVNGELLVSLVHRSWGLGSAHVGGSWSGTTAGYISGYVAKGHTSKGLAVLDGRHPEYALWPNRPGLGVPGVPELLHRICGERSPRELIAVHGDLPPSLVIDGYSRTFGGLLLDRLRSAAGMSPSDIAAAKERNCRVASAYGEAHFIVEALSIAEAIGDLPMIDLALSMIGGLDGVV